MYTPQDPFVCSSSSLSGADGKHHRAGSSGLAWGRREGGAYAMETFGMMDMFTTSIVVMV